MGPLDAILLFGAALLAGALNSVAGGGSFISFPTLIFTGVPPIAANATNTVALWPGAVASVGAYRREFRGAGLLLWVMALVSLLGGAAGALLLLKTPETTFVRVLPWLLLAATLIFALGPWLNERLRRARGNRPHPAGLVLAAAALGQVVISVYGGFFGGGIGMLMLAALSLVGMTNIHAMNALKTLLSALINGVAVVAFAVAGVVAWPQALLMIAGAVVGGYGGAWYAQKIDPRLVRRFVVLTGAAMTAYFFWNAA
ncbi:MAG: sulfite exporter TauE/SafE family protein [Acidobacteria bacterium]|nr:sulfite exporter TauE/SafE family protein [Acidobacteriota bacterium]